MLGSIKGTIKILDMFQILQEHLHIDWLHNRHAQFEY